MKKSRFVSKVSTLTASVAVAFALSGPVMAQEFSLALSSPPTTLDPHFYNLAPNVIVAQHMFEALTKMDADSRLVPNLAESWKLVNNLTWEFKLRKGVKFHDGSELTAEDVAWSLARPASVVGSPGRFDLYTRSIINTKIMDPHTIRFTTNEPSPLLPTDLASILIVSKKATQGLTNDDFSAGKGLVGTGPYKFLQYMRQDRIVLERNEDYWGKKPAWSKVTMKFIPNNATRMASLLSGDVQAIENVPTADLSKVRNDKNLNMFSKVSHRLIYLFLDSPREKTPHITDKDGKPLAKNPLMDVKVRTALSMAINRDAIKDHVMEGLSEPTNNLVPPTFTGYNPAVKNAKYDPDGAKKLLAQAGYPDGFNVTLHTPNNRYVNDEKIAQTIAQMWSKIGISTKVEGLPMSIYTTQAAKGAFSIGLLGWGTQSGEMSNALRNLMACPDPAKGMGSFNRIKYCNPKMDALLYKAVNTVDNTERAKLLQDASAIALNDVGIIPIHLQITTWAAKKGIVYTPRTDEGTVAYDFRPQ